MPRTTGTKSEREQVRHALMQFGASPAAVAVELQRQFGLRPREAFRQAHGWTQDAVAAQLNVTNGASAAFTGARISDYERWPFGGRRPTVPVLAALSRLYSAPVAALVDLDDLKEMPDNDRIAITGPTSTPLQPTVALIELATPRDTVTDLRWNVGSGFDETELVLAVTERAADFGAWAESSNVGPFTIDDVAASTRRVARDYLTEPPMTVYARTAVLADRVFRLLQTGHQPPEEALELYKWAGYLCSLLAWMAGDLGHRAAAESQARTAWICAEMVGDRTLRAWVLSTESKIRLWDHRYEEAALAAARGYDQAPQGTAAVMLACQEADAWAAAGAGESARDALNRAEAARQTASLDPVGGLLACPPVRQHNYSGAVLLRVGNAAEAIRHATQALKAADGDPTVAYGTLAQIRIWAASAQIRSGSLDGAVEVITPVLELPVERRLDTLAQRLQEVGRLVDADPSMRTSSTARGLRNLIAEFCASSVSRQLPA